MRYDRIFVLAVVIEKTESGYKFIEEDSHGFLHVEIRIEAIKKLRSQGKVNEVVAVGGKKKDGISSTKMLAELIGGDVTQLESVASTRGNIKAIKEYLEGKNGVNGLLTNFYHLPRALRIASEEGIKLIPICAESVLIREDFDRVKSWYSQESALKRIISEIAGICYQEYGERVEVS